MCTKNSTGMESIMTTYFERQLKEIEHSIHSIDIDVFEKMVNMAVETRT